MPCWRSPGVRISLHRDTTPAVPSAAVGQSSIFLRCLVELECAGEHEVSWYAVVPCLGAPLCVHGVLFVGELVQDVEGGEFECEFFLEEGAGEFRVPHQVIGVHHVAAVSSSAEHLDVGGQ